MACATGAQAQEARLTLGGPLAGNPDVLSFGGGTWRVPKVMRLAQPGLEALGEGGTYRVALAWEILAEQIHADHTPDLLAAYPLNDFLQARAKAGGEIIVSLDATPLFLAQNPGAAAQADGPGWARSPIASEAEWALIAEHTVRHFNRLGVDPIIEVWNEPDHSLTGRIEDYIRLYRATTLGARRANRATRMAGPAVSDWTALTPDGRRYAEMFFAGAALTPVPQLGLSRLPVDVVTYHSFNRVPGQHHARVMRDIAGLTQRYGYAMPPVINSEWNIAATPPYPEGDLNGEFPGAAHVGASLIAMAKAGVSGQVFQMMVDPGDAGYHAGVLSLAGTPRAAYHAFDMADALSTGALIDVVSDSSVVTALAAQRDGQLRVLVAGFAPTDLMLIREAMERLSIAQPQLFHQLTKLPAQRMVGFFKGKGRPPSDDPQAAEALHIGRESFRTELARREIWRAGGQVTLALPRPMRLVSHQVIDRGTAPKGEDIRQLDAQTNKMLRDALTGAGAQLRALGVASPWIQTYAAELTQRVDGRGALARMPDSARAQLTPIDHGWSAPVVARLDAITQDQRARLDQPTKGPAASEHLFETRPYALHLLVFEP
jgi:hypothetical protein